MPSICLLCLIGLPGAGKTKLAETVKNNYEHSYVTVIEYDKLINFESLDIGLLRKERKEILNLVRDKIAESLKQKSNSKTLIVLDDNFYYRSMRYECYLIAKEIGASFYQIFLNVPVIQCLINNRLRKESLPTEVILRMNSVLESPNPSSYHWEICSLNLKSNFDFNQVETFLNKSWQNPVKKVIKPPTDSKVQIQSNIHYADLALRKCLNKIFSKYHNSPPNFKQKIISKKSELLQKIRTGEISLPDTREKSDIIEIYSELLNEYFIESIEK